MAKQRTAIDILRSIERAIASLSAEDRALVLAWLLGKYQPKTQDAGR